MNGLKDRRRNLGPSDLQRFTVPKTEEPQPPEDGLRPVFISQGIAAHASGSAYLEVGDIKFHATVHGPQQIRGDFNDKAEITVNVHVGNFAGISDGKNLERSLADFVRSSVVPVIILDEYPKSRIVISLAVLSGSPGAPLVASAVNASILALVNAGIALNDMATAVSVSQVGSDFYTDAEVDPNTENLKEVVASYSVSTKKLVSLLVTSTGAVPRDDLRALLDRAYAAATSLREVFNAYLVEDYARESQKLTN